MTKSRLDELLPRDCLKEEFAALAGSMRQMLRQSTAEVFDRLAASVSEIPEDVFAEHRELFDDPHGLDCYEEMLLSIGFDYFPDTAERFLRDFIASQTNPKRLVSPAEGGIFCLMGKSPKITVIFKPKRIAEGDWQIEAHCPGAEIRCIAGFKSKAEIDEWLQGTRRIDWLRSQDYAK
jgi:hypothetical protein